MIISFITKEPINPDSKEAKMAANNVEISGNKVTIPVEEWERVTYQARYYCNLYSKATTVMKSQAKMLENYIVT